MIVHQPECEQMPSGLAVEQSDHPLGVSPGFLGIPVCSSYAFAIRNGLTETRPKMPKVQT